MRRSAPRDCRQRARLRSPRTTCSAACSSLKSGPARRSTCKEYDTDWDGEAYGTVSGQNSNNSVRMPERVLPRRRRRTATWRADPGAPTGEVAREPRSRRDLWDKIRLLRVGLRRSRACSTTRPSTSGTRAPSRRPNQRQQPVLGVHVPRRHGLQPGVDQPDANFLGRGPASSTSRATSTPCRLWTIVLEISVLMAQLPERRQIAERSATTSARSAWVTPTSARS